MHGFGLWEETRVFGGNHSKNMKVQPWSSEAAVLITEPPCYLQATFMQKK